MKIPVFGEGGIITTLVGVVCFALGWIVKHRVAKAEICKLEDEAIKCQSEILSEVQLCRKKYREDCVVCDALAEKLLQQIRISSEINELKTSREVFCSFLLKKVIPAYVDYVEYAALRFRMNSNDLEYLYTIEVVRELRRFVSWLQIINHTVFVDKLMLELTTVDTAIMKHFYFLASKLPRSKRSSAEYFREAIDLVIKAGDIT